MRKLQAIRGFSYPPIAKTSNNLIDLSVSICNQTVTISPDFLQEHDMEYSQKSARFIQTVKRMKIASDQRFFEVSSTGSASCDSNDSIDL